MDRLLEYFANHPFLAGGAVVAAIAVIAWELRERSQSTAAISPQELIRLMNQGATVLDIRAQEKFAEGHIQGAKRLDSHEILKAGETMKNKKEKPLVVYCDSGTLGASAVRQLAAQGFTKAFNLRGGIAAWRAENLPTARGA